jgi:hypothetical protein
MPHVVTIEHKSPAAAPMELFLNRMGDGRFTGTREAGEPYDDAAMAIQCFTTPARYRRVMPDDLILLAGCHGPAIVAHVVDRGAD